MSPEFIESFIAGIIAVAVTYIAVQRLPRTGGTELKNHGIFIACAVIFILIVPLNVRKIIFSPLTVRVIGCVYPLYESIRAVCTPDEEDDKVWLQYWISQGIVFYAAEWIEDFAETNTTLYIYFFHFEFLFFLWLLLPYTDGAALIFEKITKPYLAPALEPITKRFDGWINMLVNTVISASHIWILWAIFLFFPASLKRFITVSVGTIYPFLASIAAVITPEGDDDTFWLTYWSCFGFLFLAMDWTESYLGKIPGFYTVVIFTIVYLMVPLFNGAEKCFRNILVPLARQEEMLILRDAMTVQKSMMKKLTKDRSKFVKQKLAAMFAEDDDNKDKKEQDGGSLFSRVKEGGYQSIV